MGQRRVHVGKTRAPHTSGGSVFTARKSDISRNAADDMVIRSCVYRPRRCVTHAPATREAKKSDSVLMTSLSLSVG